MNYEAVSIKIASQRRMERIPIMGAAGRTKDVIVKTSDALVSFCGFQVPDPAFIFEFQAILSEFIAKRLSSYKENEFLNGITDVSDANIQFYITRKQDRLEIALETSGGENLATIDLDNIKAKALAAIVNKAVHAVEFN